jgi:Glyoxalase-like domain
VPPEEWGDGAYIEDPDGLAAVQRLTGAGAGATMVRGDVQDGVPDHFVMADPEGNEFCVV